MPSDQVSRRHFLRATAGAAGALVVATSTTRRSAAAGTTLEMWGFDKGRLDFARAAAQLPAFKGKHPDVTINFRQFPFSQMHDKLLAALVSGQGAPDIADVEIGRFAQFLKGERVGFVPLDDRIGAEINNIYKPAASDPWSFGGKIYGLGNELNAVVLAYRKDVLSQLGIETPFKTWDEVIAGGQKVVAGGKAKMFPLHDINFGDWFMMAQHAGTGLFDAKGNYQGDNPLSIQAMQFVHDLVYKQKIAGIAPADAQNDWFGPAYWAAVKADKFVAFWGPPWHLGNLESHVPDQSGKWAVQKLPTGLGQSKPTANYGGTGQCITEQSKNADIAWDLIKAGNLTAEGNLNDFKARTVYPSYKPAYQRPELQAPVAYFGGAKIAQIYAAVAPDLPPFNQSPYFYDAIQAIVRTVITPVMNDKTQPDAAFKDLGDQIAKLKK